MTLWTVILLGILILCVTMYDLRTGIIKLTTDDRTYADLTAELGKKIKFKDVQAENEPEMKYDAEAENDESEAHNREENEGETHNREENRGQPAAEDSITHEDREQGVKDTEDEEDGNDKLVENFSNGDGDQEETASADNVEYKANSKLDSKKAASKNATSKKKKKVTKGKLNDDLNDSFAEVSHYLSETYDKKKNFEEELKSELLGKYTPASAEQKQKLDKAKTVTKKSGTIKEGTMEDWKQKLGYSEDQEVDFDSIEPLVVKEQHYAQVPYEFLSENKALKFRIYTHNVKNGGHDDLVEGEQPWESRLSQIVSSIRFNSQMNTIVTLQEVYKFQLDDIMKSLNEYSEVESSAWKSCGTGRINGDSIGEYVPILYKDSEWDLVFSDTVWLNEKDERVAYVGWDAAYLRIVTYVTLRHKETGYHLNIFNSHFDHVGPVSRIGSAKIITDKMKEINDWPSIFCGDLNSDPQDDAYGFLIRKYEDAANLVTGPSWYGHSGTTVTGFNGDVIRNGGQNIDHIFVPKDSIKVSDNLECTDSETSSKTRLRLLDFGLLHSKFGGAYMSDHRPLVADMLLEICP